MLGLKQPSHRVYFAFTTLDSPLNYVWTWSSDLIQVQLYSLSPLLLFLLGYGESLLLLDYIPELC